MRTRPACLALTVALLAIASSLAPAAHAHSIDPVKEVDPFIGTLGAGFVFPGAAAPYGMVQNSPDTDGYLAYTGYGYQDTRIRGFSLIHTQSMGVPEGGELPFMPTTGAVSSDVMKYQSTFTHANEKATPGYYAVDLLSYGIRAELTAGTRVAIQRYRFPATAISGNVLIDAGRHIPGGSDTANVPQSTPGQIPAHLKFHSDGLVTGTANLGGRGRDYEVHFAAEFDQPMVSHGIWDTRGAAPQPGVDEVTGNGAGGFATFDTTTSKSVTMRVGVSFTSQENALGNLRAELDDFNFEALHASTRDAWSDALSVIDIDGGLPSDRRAFYTALYHAQHHPNIFNDANGEYRGYDYAVHNISDAPMNGRDYYANFSMWDTYRAEMPLLMMIAPDRVSDMMRSLAAIAEQFGRVPRWGWMNTAADFMNGEPALQVVADAYCRGLVPEDVVDTLYGNLRKLALETHRDPQFLELGYQAYPGSGGSGTLEHSLGAFALALMADGLGETNDRDALLSNAENWRNQFDESIGFMRPRYANGEWLDPYFPENPDGWREGTGWQYTWLVPHDFTGLLDSMGRKEATAKLDTFFAPNLAPVAGPELQQKLSVYGIAYYGNQYAPSNEHDLQAPWIYNWLGQAWKTQKLQRSLQSIYRATPDGLPGNDDLGTMSAWFIWSALGMYPVTPGSPTVTFGSPLFPRATIYTGEDTALTITARGTSHAVKYLHGVEVNGSKASEPYGTLSELHDGTINFKMSALPRLDLWHRASPPSQSKDGLAKFACGN